MSAEPKPADAAAIEAFARRIDPGAWLPVMFTTSDANLRRNCKRRREETLRKAALYLNPTKTITCLEPTS